MRLITLLLLVAFPSTLWAQDPAPQPPPTPIIEQAITITTEEIVLSRELTSPQQVPQQSSPYQRKLFWLGLALAVTGAVITGVAVTTARESDLSQEHPAARINVHLAPCGTDPLETDLPIADCKVNDGLLYLGLGVTAAGTALTVYSLAVPPTPAPMLQYKVRF